MSKDLKRLKDKISSLQAEIKEIHPEFHDEYFNYIPEYRKLTYQKVTILQEQLDILTKLAINLIK